MLHSSPLSFACTTSSRFRFVLLRRVTNFLSFRGTIVDGTAVRDIVRWPVSQSIAVCIEDLNARTKKGWVQPRRRLSASNIHSRCEYRSESKPSQHYTPNLIKASRTETRMVILQEKISSIDARISRRSFARQGQVVKEV